MRANQKTIVFAAETGTDADRTSVVYNNPHGKAVVFLLRLANASSFNGVLRVQVKDDEGTWTNLYSFAAQTTNGTKLLHVGPHYFGSDDDFTDHIGGPLPAEFRVLLDVAAGSADTGVVMYVAG